MATFFNNVRNWYRIQIIFDSINKRLIFIGKNLSPNEITLEPGGTMKIKFAVFWILLVMVGGLIYSPLSFTDIPAPDQMSPSEIYARCYAKLVRKPIVSNDPKLELLRSGTLADAELACIALLDRAGLSASIGQLADKNDIEARAILTTMQMLHNSWFQSQTILLNRAKGESKLLLDNDEPGLFWTRALFRKTTRADSVLKYDKALKSIRVREDDGGITNFQARSFFNYVGNVSGVTQRDPLLRLGFMNDIKLSARDGINYSFMDIPNGQLSNFGEMIGIKDQAPLTVKRMIIPNTGDANANSVLRDPTKGPNLDVDLHAHFGGGVIGSIVYGLKNTNFVENQVAASYSQIDRRFASRIFQDLLCYQLPVLQASDVESNVNPKSPFPFQQNNSCMQCHGTIDELALIQRNYVWVSSSLAAGNFDASKAPPKGAEGLTRFKLPVTAGSSVFALQSPEGELHFRTFSGNKVKLPIKSFAEVGNEFAKLDDFYLCAAKRYYKYFTGIDVPLGEEPSDSLERSHLETVKALGQQLQNDPNQNLRVLVGNIFKTEAFQSRNFKSQGSVK